MTACYGEGILPTETKVMNEFITIAIPCYNRIEYFNEAIQGALNQTVPCRILVVDNASPTDDYERACTALEDPRIRYVRNETNVGMFGNWNRCIELSDTPYIHILGDDDVVSIRYVESFMNAMSENPLMDIFFSGVRHMGSSDGMFCENDGSKVPFGWINSEDLRWWAGFRGLKMPSVSATFRKSLFSHGGFNVKRHSANDYEFIYTLPRGSVLYGSTDTLYTYRIHPMADTAKNYGVAFCNYPLIYHRAAGLASTDYPGLKGTVLSFLLRMQADGAMSWWAQVYAPLARQIARGEMPGYEDLRDLIESSYPELHRKLLSEDSSGETTTARPRFTMRILSGFGFVFSLLQRLRISAATP